MQLFSTALILVSSTPCVRGLRQSIVCLVSLIPWVVPNQFKLPPPAAVTEGSALLHPMTWSGEDDRLLSGLDDDDDNELWH